MLQEKLDIFISSFKSVLTREHNQLFYIKRVVLTTTKHLCLYKSLGLSKSPKTSRFSILYKAARRQGTPLSSFTN